MHFSDTIGNLGIVPYFFLLVCKLFKSGLQIIHYILEVSKTLFIVYIGKYLVLTYIERLFFVAFFAIFVGQ